MNNLYGKSIFDTINVLFNEYEKPYLAFSSCDENEDNYLSFCLDFCNVIIKDFSLLHFFKIDENTDEDFQNIYEELNSFYKNFNTIYNCTKNFASKKNEYLKSFPLSFNNSAFGSGWSLSKEKQHKSCIFIKDNKYYFGYLVNTDFEFELTDDKKNSYQKMCYMQTQDCTKFVGKMLFTKKLKEHFEQSNEDFIVQSPACESIVVSKEIFDIYNNKKYLTSRECRIKYINFLKLFLTNKYINRQYFNFSSLKDSADYEMFDDFIDDYKNYNYNMFFENVSEACIERLQKENKLWLFQIYNQDYSDYKKSNNKNIHTLLFESCFSEENRSKNFPIKLAGGFEVRYREKGVDANVIHKKGSILLNKKDKNGNKIPNQYYCKLLAYVNGNKVTLNEEEKAYIKNDLLVTHVALYDIIKDKRYLKPQFQIHLPIEINRCKDKDDYPQEMNEKIDKYVKNHKCNIIGIDRGERNLLCASIINGQTGKIIEKICFDNIDGVNYNDILTDIQNSRDIARKTWNSIPDIKNTKKGYLSLVIKKIVDLVEKYDAIISLENLNGGFINSRKKIEKSIYQQFVNQLINKLSYMIVDKQKSVIGVKQLAFNKCTSEIHNGIIYYVNPSYTSKIDVNTGFANLFDFNKITNAQKRKEFFEKMNISFNNNLYKFEFDYKNFKTYNNYLDNKKFVVSSFGDRIKKVKNQMGYWESKTINLNDELNDVFGNIDKNNIQEVILNDDKICAKVFEIFKLIVQLRNTNDKIDYLISPVEHNGKYFDTRNNVNDNPDITASYNIAIKAMLKVYHDKLKNEDYFEYFCSR